jgi:hypothetical protein
VLRMIKRSLPLIVVALTLLLTPVAVAAYFIPRATAQHHAAEHFIAIGYRHAIATCTPRGARVGQRLYHRWVCSFEAGDGLAPSCSGSILIEGSASSFYRRVGSHRGRCPHGV